MKSILVIIFSISFIQYTSAQTFNWGGQMDGQTGRPRPNSIHTDKDGNIYTTGRFSGTVDFDPGPGVTNLTTVGSSEGIYIQKINANGNLIWAKHMEGSINGEGFSVATDNLANVYAIGYFRGTVDFDPGPSTNNLISTSPTFNDLFIQKLDVDGNLIWVKQLKNVYDSTPNASLAVSEDGDVYCTGFFKGILDFDPSVNEHSVSSGDNFVGFILKLDTSGNFSWVNTFNTTSAGIAITTNGTHVVVTGFFSGNFVPDTGTPTNVYTSKGLTDTFVLKLTSGGTFVWAKQIGGPGSDYGRAIALDNSANIFLAGEFQQTSDFNIGSTPTTLSSEGQSDIFLQKLDPSGNLLWVNQIGGTASDFPKNISISSTGYIHLSGQFSGSANFKIGAAPRTFNAAGSNMFILQVSPSQKIDWLMQYQGNQLLMAAGGGYVYATGAFSSTVDFDPGEDTYSMTAPVVGSTFVLKLGIEVITGIEDSEASDLSVYPNPIKSFAILNIDSKNTDKFTIRVFDMQMRIVKEHIIDNGNENNVDMTDLCEGVYIMEVQAANMGVRTIRLIKN